MARTWGHVLVGLMWCTLMWGTCWADAPKTLNYQGYLTDGAGAPITGTKAMVFSLYAVPSGGSPLWSESQGSVAVTNGMYQVTLGLVTPLNLAFDQSYYLGLAVGGEPEMTPRQPLTGTPYAMGLAPGSVVSQSDATYSGPTLSISTNSTTAVALAVTKNGLYGNGASFVLTEPTNNYSAVYGYTEGTGAGIYGVSMNNGSGGQFDIGGTANSKPALLAQTLGTGNAGKFVVNNPSSNNHVVYATTNGSGYGVWANSTSGIGVYGSSTSGNGIFGITSNGVTGVTGRADNASGYGVYGVNWATGAYGYLGKDYGVYGNSSASVGVRGQSSTSYGVYGSSTSSSGVYGSSASSHGVYGENTSATSGIAGVYGRASNTTGTTYGVMGYCAGNTSYAVYGMHGPSTNYGYLGTNGYGAFGRYSTGNYGGLGGSTAGVVGAGTSGVYAVNSSNSAINAYLATDTYAGDFSSSIRVKGDINREYVSGAPKNAVPVAYGTVNSNGTISAGSGNFTVTYNSASTWYEIAITGESYHYTTHTTVVTPVGASSPSFATTSSVSGHLIVAIYNTSNVKLQNMFNFVVYRP